jgi:hypothetical protein
MPSLAYRFEDGRPEERRYYNKPAPAGGRKVACVFQEENGKWAGFSCPTPAAEIYGTDDQGEAVCSTHEEAIAACLKAGCIVITEDEFRRLYV